MHQARRSRPDLKVLFTKGYADLARFGGDLSNHPLLKKPMGDLALAGGGPACWWTAQVSRLCGPGEWLVEKHATRTRRSWRKLHIGVDADTGQIIAAELTSKDVDDGSQVGPLLE